MTDQTAAKELKGLSNPVWQLSALVSLVCLLAALILMTRVMAYFWGFVQDDAYISLRYASNLAQGNGLVFNPGERVEGFTNLSWTLLAALLFTLHIPMLPALRLLGAAASLGLLCLLWIETAGPRRERHPGACWTAGLAALLLASSTALSLWSISGMEESFFTFLLFAGYHAYSRGRFVPAAGLLLAATLTRPEGALAFGVAVLVRGAVILLASRKPTADEKRAFITYVVGFGLLLAFRYFYYGELVPNTYFVKGVANVYSHKHGFAEFGRFLKFNNMYWILALAYLGLFGNLLLPSRPGHPDPTDRKRPMNSPAPGGARGECFGNPAVVCVEPPRRPPEEIAFSLTFLTLFQYYLIRVGGDLLPFYRLYIPMLPFTAMWAARGVQWCFGLGLVKVNDCGDPVKGTSAGWLLGTAGLTGALILAGLAVKTSFSHPEYAGSNAALANCHGKLGLFLQGEALLLQGTRRLTVLGQDMGLTPYVAPNVRFVDVIGLTDPFVAKTLYSNGYTPYLRYLMWPEPGMPERIRGMEKRVHEYLEAQNADYMIVNVYCENSDIEKVRAAIARLDEGYFAPKSAANTFYYGLAGTSDFTTRYRLIKGFEFSQVHHLLLYKRMYINPTSQVS